jgi:hypothetical protein
MAGRSLCLLILALLVARGALVLALGDVFFYGDELEKGAAGVAMLDGLGADIGHHRLAYHYYEGGGFVVSHLDALAFRLVGANLLALKLVALAFDVAILLAGCSLAARAFGEPAAVLFGILFVLAPESVQKNSLLTLGIHWQALLFALVVLDRGGRIALEGDGSRSNWLWLGLAAGFGTYFNYLVGLTVGFVGLWILARRARLLFSRPARWGWGGLALGLAPLLGMYALVGEQVVDIHGASLLGGGDPWGRLVPFLSSLYTDRTALDLTALILIPATPIVGLGALLGSGSRRWAVFLAAYVVLFFAIYLTSEFAVGKVNHYFAFHRLSQPWVVTLLLAAGGLAALRARGGAARALGTVLAGALALLGARSTFDVVARGNTVDLARNWEVLTSTKGYRFDHYVDKLWTHFEGEDEGKVRALKRLRDRELLDFTLAVNLFGHDPRPLDEVLRAAGKLGLDREESVLALGAMWRERYPGRLPERRAAILENESVDAALLPLVDESLGRFGLGFQVRMDRVRDELQIGRVHQFPDAYFRGLGYRLYSAMGDLELSGYWRQTNSPCFVDPDRGLGFIGAQSARVQPLLLEGFRRAAADHSLP